MPNEANSTRKGNTHTAAVGASPQKTIKVPETAWRRNRLKKDIFMPRQLRITGAKMKPATPVIEKMAELR